LPLCRHDRRCVHSHLGRRPGFGPGLPRPEHVPFLPFLPASTVFSAEGRSEDPPFRRLASLLHLAASCGVHHVSDSLVWPFGRPVDPEVVDPKVRRVFPCGEYPSKRSPPRQPSTMPSPRVVLSDSAAFTGWRALSPFDVNPLACRHAALFTPSTSGRCSTEESVAATQPFGCAPLDAPMGFGSTRFFDAAALSRRPDVSVLDVSPRGSKPASASPTRKVEGRQGVSALSGSVRPVLAVVPKDDGSPGDGRFQPEGWCAPLLSIHPEGRKETGRVRLRCVPEGSISASSHNGPRRYSGMPVDPPRGENPPRRSAHPKALGSTKSRQLPEGRPSRSSARSEERRRWFELRLSFLPRSPAYMRERLLAAHSRSPEGDQSSAHRSRPHLEDAA